MAPETANSGTGIVYPHHDKGQIVYFTAFQATSEFLLSSLFPILCLISFGLAPKKNFRDFRGRWAFRVEFEFDGSRWIIAASNCVGALCASALFATLGPAIVDFLINHGLVPNLG